MMNLKSFLKDESGAVTLDGFYDGVEEIPETIQKMWQDLGFSAEEFLGEVGLSAPSGEAGRSVLEQTWARATANGDTLEPGLIAHQTQGWRGASQTAGIPATGGSHWC